MKSKYIETPLRNVLPKRIVDIFAKYWCDSDDIRKENLGEFIQRIAQTTLDLQNLQKDQNSVDDEFDSTDLCEAGWECSQCQYKNRYNKKLECSFRECLAEFKKKKEADKKAAKEIQEIVAKREKEEKNLLKNGYDIWYDDGRRVSKKIDPNKFGPHKYADHDGTSDCKYGCGCWMGPSRSGGPVNPFGACPKNPKKVEI